MHFRWVLWLNCGSRVTQGLGRHTVVCESRQRLGNSDGCSG